MLIIVYPNLKWTEKKIRSVIYIGRDCSARNLNKYKNKNAMSSESANFILNISKNKISSCERGNESDYVSPMIGKAY